MSKKGGRNYSKGDRHELAQRVQKGNSRKPLASIYVLRCLIRQTTYFFVLLLFALCTCLFPGIFSFHSAHIGRCALCVVRRALQIDGAFSLGVDVQMSGQHQKAVVSSAGSVFSFFPSL